MKAIGCQKGLATGNMNVLMDIELPVPKATGHDLLVEIHAVAVNPVDSKVRSKMQSNDNNYVILGWDAAGVVKAVGEKVTLFKAGDEVWYAGDVTRPGCNSEFQLVDERLVGLKPKSLSFEQAAALPLTSLTAWELLFDRLKIPAKKKANLLICGAGGGVGSILVQLARQLTNLTIIGTAARESSKAWVKDNGAQYVIDHSRPMHQQLIDLGIHEVDYVSSLTYSEQHAEDLVTCLKPEGKFALIDDPIQLDIKIFKLKSISIYWEMMFTRSFYKTKDMIKQHEILMKMATLVDEGTLRTTFNENFGTINAVNLDRAHKLMDSGRAIGKIVLSGF